MIIDQNSSLSLSMFSFNRSDSSDHGQYVQLTKTTSMNFEHRLEAHASTSSNPLLTETSLIILICSTTIVILLFCLALVCLCRRHMRRTISPSVDTGYPTFFTENHPENLSERFDFNIPTTRTSPKKMCAIRKSSPHLTKPIRKIKKKRLGGCCCYGQRRTYGKSKTIKPRTQSPRKNEF